MEFISQELGFADCRKDPAKWNEQWEDYLKVLAPVNIMKKSFMMLPEDVEEEILSNHRGRVRDLCEFQKRLTVVAAESLTRDHFESKWLKSSASQREKHILEGMVRTCTAASGMEDHRMICDEVTLPYLQKDGGRGFLGLLKCFMIEDPTVGHEDPIYISNPRWDAMVGKKRKDLSERELIMQAYGDGIRNTFLCESWCYGLVILWPYIQSSTGHFLFDTLASFHGHPPIPVHVSKPASRNRIPAVTQKETAKLLGKSTAKRHEASRSCGTGRGDNHLRKVREVRG